MEVFELGQQRRTGNGPNVTTPTPAKQRSQRPARIVRGAGAYQINGRRRSVAAPDARAPQHVVQLALAAGAKLKGLAPRIRLLADFAGGVLQPTFRFFLLR